MPPAFMPGMELSRRLYEDAVRPLLSRYIPGVAHTAALIGAGSEVLGFDTERSTDHDWGPRLQLFLTAGDLAAHGATIRSALATELPDSVAGFRTDFGPASRPGVPGRRGTATGVEVTTLGDWFTGHLGFDPLHGVTVRDWLATPTQLLAQVTAGVVHHDGLSRLHRARSALAWYPDDLWRYVLACQWHRIGQEEHFVGRCGEAGDEIGSAVIAARLARDVMRLCLLIDRCYPPYAKWLGTAVARRPGTGRLRVALSAALAAGAWPDRERHLGIAYEAVAARQNDLGLVPPLDPRVRPFHDRPFQVLQAGRFTRALIDSITDPAVRGLPLTGAIDQFADSTDALTHPTRSRALAAALHPPER